MKGYQGGKVDLDALERPSVSDPRGGTALLAGITPENCWRLHRNYIGAECAYCGLAIPPGPYGQKEFLHFFHRAVWVGARREGDPDPAEVANPPTAQEVALDAELAAARARIAVTKLAWEQVVRDGPIVPEAPRLHLGPLTFVMPDPVYARPITEHQAQQRAARIRAAQNDYDRRVAEAHEAYKVAYEECAKVLRRWNAAQAERSRRLALWRGMNPGAA